MLQALSPHCPHSTSQWAAGTQSNCLSLTVTQCLAESKDWEPGVLPTPAAGPVMAVGSDWCTPTCLPSWGTSAAELCRQEQKAKSFPALSSPVAGGTQRSSREHKFTTENARGCDTSKASLHSHLVRKHSAVPETGSTF